MYLLCSPLKLIAINVQCAPGGTGPTPCAEDDSFLSRKVGPLRFQDAYVNMLTHDACTDAHAYLWNLSATLLADKPY